MKLAAVLWVLLLLAPPQADALCRELQSCCSSIQVEIVLSPEDVAQKEADGALVFGTQPSTVPGTEVELLAYAPDGEPVYLLVRTGSRLRAFLESDACQDILQQQGYRPVGGWQSKNYPHGH